MRRVWLATLGLTVMGAAVALGGESVGEKAKEAKSVYAFTVQDIDGKDVSLSDYKGKVCLIVNVASQ